MPLTAVVTSSVAPLKVNTSSLRFKLYFSTSALALSLVVSPLICSAVFVDNSVFKSANLSVNLSSISVFQTLLSTALLAALLSASAVVKRVSWSFTFSSRPVTLPLNAVASSFTFSMSFLVATPEILYALLSIA